MNYLVGHLIGDWLLQNDWMSKNKPKLGVAFVVHILVVSVSLSLVTGWWDYRGALALVSHALIDGLQLPRRWMAFYNQSPYEWLRLVIDQAMHIISLYCISMIQI